MHIQVCGRCSENKLRIYAVKKLMYIGVLYNQTCSGVEDKCQGECIWFFACQVEDMLFRSPNDKKHIRLHATLDQLL